MENNLSETVFYIPLDKGFHIRWFTPTCEVDLCGHATLAAAWVLYHELGYEEPELAFLSRSGSLHVRQERDALLMDFPQTPYRSCDTPQTLIDALGCQPLECYQSDDYMLVLESEEAIQNLKPDLNLLQQVPCRGVMVTAQGCKADFVSRFFAPRFGIDEDPVTGSAHTVLAPYWSSRLDKATLTAQQLSKRGGQLTCKVTEDRVLLGGRAVTYLEGTLRL